MKKIPTLFMRDPEDRSRVLPEVTPGCEWVLAGEGVATRKFDGTCVKHEGGYWWARREVKPGKDAPDGWVEADHDAVTGKRMGWELITKSPFIVQFREAVEHMATVQRFVEPGTYELCGPKVNGNPEGFTQHVLVRHGAEEITELPLWFEGLRDWLAASDFEGVVWHHPDGRMAKLKRRDFVLGRNR